jgi:hypothetical protein
MPLDADKALLEAYEQLNAANYAREASTVTAYSILLSGSLILVTLAFSPCVSQTAKVLPLLGAAASPSVRGSL